MLNNDNSTHIIKINQQYINRAIKSTLRERHGDYNGAIFNE